LQRIRPFELPGPLPDSPADERVSAKAVADSYASTVRLVRALARGYGFAAIHAWQPTIHSTRKPLTPGEASLLERIAADPYGAELVRLHRELPDLLAAAVPDDEAGSFLDLAAVFDDESRPVFGDAIGHTHEHANTTLADALAPAIAGALRARGVEISCSEPAPR
jgi:hypothetical protein